MIDTNDRNELIDAIIPAWIRVRKEQGQKPESIAELKFKLGNLHISELRKMYTAQVQYGFTTHQEAEAAREQLRQATQQEAQAARDTLRQAALNTPEGQRLLQERNQIIIDSLWTAFTTNHPEVILNQATKQLLWNRAASLSEDGGVTVASLEEALKLAGNTVQRSNRQHATSANLEQDRKTLQIFCEANNLGFSEAALLLLRKAYGGGINYNQILDAVKRKLVILGPPSAEETEKYAADYQTWEKQERLKLAEIIADSDQSWMTYVDRNAGVGNRWSSTHGDVIKNESARDEAIRKIANSTMTLQELQSRVEVIEHNKKLIGLSISELRQRARQEAQVNVPATAPQTEVNTSTHGGDTRYRRTVPVMPYVDSYTGEQLSEDFFHKLWATDRVRFRQYTNRYGAEQVLARMQDSAAGHQELERLAAKE